jgi:Cu/Ag efflux pump CusA
MLLFQKTRVASEESRLSGWLKDRVDHMSPTVPRLAIGVAVVLTAGALFLLPRLQAPSVPTFKESDLLVKWDAAPGTSRPAMNRMIDRVNRELRALPGVRNVGAHVGRAILSDQVVGIHSAELWVSIDPKADYDATVTSVRDVVGTYPGVDADVMTYLRSRFGEALSGIDEPIVVRVYGQRQDVLQREAEKVRAAIAGVEGIVEPHVHVESTEPVVEIKVDLDAAMEHGVKPGDVRRAAATLLAGINVGNLFEEQKVFEVVVWGEPQIRHSVDAIHDLLVDTPSGGHVRLGDVAKVRITAAPNVIQRENVARTLDVVANVKGRDVAAVAADVQARIRGTAFPLEYRAELVGDFAKQELAKARVRWAAVAVAIGILFVLQAAFGRWSMAFVFLLTLPVVMAGSVLAAVATGSALSLGSLAGMLTVLGLAVRHGILLIQRYRGLRREGMEAGPELILRGTRDRVTPIVTTTLVTAAAVLPFAVFGARSGHEILGPMALVILGGLVTSTLHSLCIVPALYARFGASVAAETVEDDLEVGVDHLVPARS